MADAKWTREDTEKLIELRGRKYATLFKGKTFNNAAAWQKVQTDLNNNHSTKAISKKWSNLVQKYKSLKDPPTGRSTEDGELTANTWPFYGNMDAVMRDRHIITPSVVITSSPNTSTTGSRVQSPQPGPSGVASKKRRCTKSAEDQDFQRRCYRLKELQIEQNNRMLELLNQFVVMNGGEGLGAEVEVPLPSSSDED